MKYLVLFLISFQALSSYKLNAKWMEYSADETKNIRRLIEILSLSSTGKKLIQEARVKAFSLDAALIEILKSGDSSMTDTTLVRRFDPQDPGHIIYETKSMIVINKYHNYYDAILDLSHELSHFIHREPFNPYAESFDVKSFVKSTIEGVGGEVEAFMTECRVLSELFPTQVRDKYNCLQIMDPETGRISKKMAIKRFYQVGEYHDQVKKLIHKHKLDGHFPHISEAKAPFISSAYGVPYPLAAFFEYTTVYEKACENDQKRIEHLRESRSPASLKVLATLKRGHEHRCRNLF
jgi:hypothetical protein